jgi:hypothetical protein
MSTKSRKRVERIVADYQQYVATYSDQPFYQSYMDQTLIADFLYGIGLAFDREKYRGADGFDLWKAELRKHVGCTASTSTEVQP